MRCNIAGKWIQGVLVSLNQRTDPQLTGISRLYNRMYKIRETDLLCDIDSTQNAKTCYEKRDRTYAVYGADMPPELFGLISHF